MILNHGEIATAGDLVASMEEYDWLECDGFANVLHSFLDQAGIEHRVVLGQVASAVDDQIIDWHMWIELEGPEGIVTADNNLARWLKIDGLPRGLFKQLNYSHLIVYQNPTTTYLSPLPSGVISALLLNPSEQIEQLKKQGRARIF